MGYQEKDEPDHEPLWPAHVDFRGAIAPGATEILIARAPTHFRGEMLAMPPDVAGSIAIADIRVGLASQLAGRARIAIGDVGQVPNAIVVLIRMPLQTARPNESIELEIVNMSTAPLLFSARLFGVASDQASGA